MKIKISQLVSLFDVPVSVSEETRRQRLLDILLGVFGCMALIVVISAIAIWETQKALDYTGLLAVFFSSVFIVPILAGLFVLNHSRAAYLAGPIFVVLLLILGLFDTPAQLANGRGLLFFSLPIIASSILIRPSASFILALVSSVIVEIAAFLTDPSPQPLPPIVVFFLLATLIWMATLSLERHIERLSQANTALRESEERYRTLVEISPDLVALTDPGGKLMLVNPAGLALFGYVDAEEVAGKPVWEFFLPEDRPRAKAVFDRLRENQASERDEYRALNKEGVSFWVELSASVIKDSAGQPQAMLSVGRDVTLRKKMEQALLAEKDGLESEVIEKTIELRQTNERLDELVVRSPTVLYNLGLSEDQAISFISENVSALLGYAAHQFIEEGDFWKGRIHPDDQQVAQIDLSHLKKAGSLTRQYRFLHKDGSYRWIRDEVKETRDLNGRPLGLVGSWVDITPQKLIEEALRERERRYRELFENASLAIFQSALDGKVIAVNPEFARMFGYQSPEDFKAVIKDTSEIFADPQRRAEIIRLRTENPALNVFENIYLRKDGSTFIGQLTVKTITDEAGQLQFFEGFIEDITSRKQTERALRESEERYRSLAETAHDIIVIINADDQIEYVNQYAAQLIGMTSEEIVGLPRSRFFPVSINDRHLGNFQKVFEHGQPMFTESRLPLPRGELWLSSWLVPLKDESGAVKKILGISRDITERKALEESLRDAKNSLEQRVAERTAELESSRAKLRELTHLTVSAQENERRRLSRELHDQTGQALIGLKFSLDEILAETPPDLDETRGKIAKTMTQVDELNRQIRNLAHGLRPPILDVAGIDLALKDFCRNFSDETRFPLTYSGAGDLPGLSEEVSISLYRFVQEAVTNVVKHARASEAYVSLRREAGGIVILVKDNGTGFDAASTPKGIGLLGMEERLGLLGGRLEIKSGRRRGTTLKAVIPLTGETRTF
jgi:two-component system sensor histidine kinase UhpB